MQHKRVTLPPKREALPETLDMARSGDQWVYKSADPYADNRERPAHTCDNACTPSRHTDEFPNWDMARPEIWRTDHLAYSADTSVLGGPMDILWFNANRAGKMHGFVSSRPETSEELCTRSGIPKPHIGSSWIDINARPRYDRVFGQPALDTSEFSDTGFVYHSMFDEEGALIPATALSMMLKNMTRSNLTPLTPEGGAWLSKAPELKDVPEPSIWDGKLNFHPGLQTYLGTYDISKAVEAYAEQSLIEEYLNYEDHMEKYGYCTCHMDSSRAYWAFMSNTDGLRDKAFQYQRDNPAFCAWPQADKPVPEMEA